MSRIIFLLIVSLATAAQAQQYEQNFEFKNLSGEQANRAVIFVDKIMNGKARIIFDSFLRKTVIVSDNAAQARHAAELLEKFDVAPPSPPEPSDPIDNVEFTIHLLGAYAELPEAGRGSQAPASLDSVVKEMQGAFTYKAFRLLDVIPVRAKTAGETEYSGILPAAAVGTPAKHFYKVSIERLRVNEKTKTAFVSMFRFSVDIPNIATGAKEGETGIRTQLTIRPGQRVVLGKIKLDAGDNAVFLVVTAKI